ncbi:hypothetical protein LTR10_001615 [Elasticomyces elasticus]|nr:hypothetical protein LTR10_001615 [Elasticomyces elasticus]KAK4975119.1 hypothetical protein LTR42_004329 [Elasticomyces elasticus]
MQSIQDDEIQLETDQIVEENYHQEMQIIDDGAARTTSSGKSANLTHPQTGANEIYVVAAMESIVEENFQMEKQIKQSRTRFSTKWIRYVSLRTLETLS